jgi:protein-S-isoprenylcysteine O-methyltransferase Ste14
MKFIYHNLFLVLWLSWGIYWLVTSQNVKANVWRESRASRLLHVVPLLLAGLLLMQPGSNFLDLSRRLWPVGNGPFWVGASITALGLVFSVWGRIHIGRNWSGTVTLKEGHELITSGPYAWVRHPIYTGLLLGFAGTAIARGDWQGVLAVVIASVTLWLKLRVEERGMHKHFGDTYKVYSQRVPALLPFIL